MSKTTNILLVGVGGQGTILASKILSTGLINAGYDVKMSEVHGMAQRGGSVTTQVRYGEKVYSPIIGKGQANIIVAFEKMEAMRWIDYLNLNGKLVVNDYQIPSVPILTGEAQYPEEIINDLQEKAATTVINAGQIAAKIGNPKTQNVVMLGALIQSLQIDEVDWEAVIRDTVKPRFIDINIEAFNKGKEMVE